MNDPRLETFEKAFHSGGAGFTRECNCGRVFFDVSRNGWDTTPEELDALEKTAIPLNYAVETIGSKTC